MIPKVIHYCWFGGKPLPELAQKCIASWKRYCPDYEIREWNESNYDLKSCDYAREAYEAKKWAFVSDYVRFDILYQHGGLYFDTDVELIRPIDDIVAGGPFMGCEYLIARVPGTTAMQSVSVVSMFDLGVNPGLGLGATPGLGLYKEILIHYRHAHFLLPNGEQDHTTVVDRTTAILKKHGFQQRKVIQEIAGIMIYPPSFFCPLNYETGELEITGNTCSIHHYAESWHSRGEKCLSFICRFFNRKGRIGRKIGLIVQMPLRIYCKIERSGWKGTALYLRERLKRQQKW